MIGSAPLTVLCMLHIRLSIGPLGPVQHAVVRQAIRGIGVSVSPRRQCVLAVQVRGAFRRGVAEPVVGEQVTVIISQEVVAQVHPPAESKQLSNNNAKEGGHCHIGWAPRTLMGHGQADTTTCL